MSPPYMRLRAAERMVRKQYPDAHSVKALWSPSSSRNDVLVVVQIDRHGRAVTVDPGCVTA